MIVEVPEKLHLTAAPVTLLYGASSVTRKLQIKLM